MPKFLEPGQTYARRREGCVVLNCTVDRDVMALLQQHVPGKRNLGAFLGRIVTDYVARVEERQRILQAIGGQEEVVSESL